MVYAVVVCLSAYVYLSVCQALPSDMADGRVTSFLGACSTNAEIVQHETSHWTKKVQNYTVVKKNRTPIFFPIFCVRYGMGLLDTQVISKKCFSQVFARGRHYGAERAIR